LIAAAPIWVTLLGIVRLVKPEQTWNAYPAMLVTLYVTSPTAKLDKIVIAPVAEADTATVATPEPST
jgi:hypothetical protein